MDGNTRGQTSAPSRISWPGSWVSIQMTGKIITTHNPLQQYEVQLFCAFKFIARFNLPTQIIQSGAGCIKQSPKSQKTDRISSVLSELLILLPIRRAIFAAGMFWAEWKHSPPNNSGKMLKRINRVFLQIPLDAIFSSSCGLRCLPYD